ncbi:MAG: hypothetical protein HQ559_02550 [Lentisphaerae bacterium]|nr:hypothetical protein [Lentisphaerota bacterium]
MGKYPESKLFEDAMKIAVAGLRTGAPEMKDHGELSERLLGFAGLIILPRKAKQDSGLVDVSLYMLPKIADKNGVYDENVLTVCDHYLDEYANKYPDTAFANVRLCNVRVIKASCLAAVGRRAEAEDLYTAMAKANALGWIKEMAQERLDALRGADAVLEDEAIIQADRLRKVGNEWVYTWSNSQYQPTPVTERWTIDGLTDAIFIGNTIVEGAFDEFSIWLEITRRSFRLYGTASHKIDKRSTPRLEPQRAMPIEPMKFAWATTFWGTSGLIATTLEVGEDWEDYYNASGGEYRYNSKNEIVSAESVVVTAGRFDDCVKVRSMIDGPDAFGRGVRWVWFSPTTGIVKVVYEHEEGSVTNIELVEYKTSH